MKNKNINKYKSSIISTLLITLVITILCIGSSFLNGTFFAHASNSIGSWTIGNKVYTSSDNPAFININMNMNLFAEATTKGTVIADLNADDATMDVTEYEIGVGSYFLNKIGTPTRFGYTFNGWWLDPTSESEEYAIDYSTKLESESLTIYAHWNAQSSTVKLNLNYKLKNPYAEKILAVEHTLYADGETALTDDDIIVINGVPYYVLQIDTENKKAELITKNIFDVRFNPSNTGNVDEIKYNTSDLKQWMDNFYRTKLESSPLVLDTNVNYYYLTSGNVNNLSDYTNDSLSQKVFALPAEEAFEYADKFTWDGNDDDYTSEFWTTAGFNDSPSSWDDYGNGSYIRTVGYDGDNSYVWYDTVNGEYTGARPAFWISLSTEEIQQYAEPKTLNYGDTYGELPQPTRPGMTFLGWFPMSDNYANDINTEITKDTLFKVTGEQKAKEQYASCSIDGCDTEIYAHWGINNLTINFEYIDTGTFYEYISETEPVTSIVTTLPGEITLPGCVWDIYAYDMIGWSTKADLPNSKITNPNDYIGDINEEVTLKLTDDQFTCSSSGCSTTFYSSYNLKPIVITTGDKEITYADNQENNIITDLSVELRSGSLDLTWSLDEASTVFRTSTEIVGNELLIKKNADEKYNIPAGTYPIKIACHDNITGQDVKKEITITVNKLEIPTPCVEEINFDYNGSEKTLIDNIPEELEMFVEKTNISETIPGNYQATYHLIDTNNTVWDDGTSTDKNISWTINSVANAISLNLNSAFVSIPNDITITVTVNNDLDLEYEATCSDPNIEISGNNYVSENVFETVITPYKEGTYTITFTSEAFEGYTSETQTLTLQVAKGTFDITNIHNTYTYDRNQHQLAIDVNPDDAEIEYSIDNKETWDSFAPSLTEVGKQHVDYRITKQGYETIEDETDLIIKPFTLTEANVAWDYNDGCSLLDDGLTYSCTYNDETKVEPKILVSGVEKDGASELLEEGTDYYVTYSGNVSGPSTVTVQGLGNYTGIVTIPFDIETDQIRYTIFAQNLFDATGEHVDSGSLELTEGGYIGTSEVTYNGTEMNGDVYFSTIPDKAVVRFGTEYGTYDYRQVPTYKNAGTYRIYFKISLINFDTIEGSFDIKISRLPVAIPTTEDVCLNISGEGSPTWIGYNPFYMAIGGQVSGTTEGSYTTNFDLQDKVNTKWAGIDDPTLETKVQHVTWNIVDYCEVEDFEEETYTLNAEFGKYCKLELVDKNTLASTNAFTRPGMVQIGWLEDRGGSSKKYDLDSSVINLETDEGASHDLYALWQTSTYNLSIDYDGGSINPKDYVLEDTEQIINEETGETGTYTPTSNEIKTNPTVVSYNSYFVLSTPQKPGYTFKGWSIWNMDDSEHIIGSIVSHENTITTDESYFRNLTSVANSTVYFKAIWQQNQLWVDNADASIVTLPSAQEIHALNRARNGSGSYKYEITSVSPRPTFTSGPQLDGPSYGFTIDNDTMKVKVPAYLKDGEYTIQIKVTDEFTDQVKNFYLILVVSNPSVKVDGKDYLFRLGQNWHDWYPWLQSGRKASDGIDIFTKGCQEAEVYPKTRYKTDNDFNEYLGKAPVRIGADNDNR